MSRRMSAQFAEPRGTLVELSNHNSLFAAVGGLPIAGQAGHAPGAITIDSQNGAVYYNVGTAQSASWQRFDPRRHTVANDTANVFSITVNSTSLYTIDTRTTTVNATTHTFSADAATLASENAAHSNPVVRIAGRTINYTGTTTVPSHHGANLYVAGAVFQNTSAQTITSASSVHIEQISAAGSLTITNPRMITTGVSDCFLTNAGVWTDTSSSGKFKEAICDAAREAVLSVLRRVRPRSFQYRPDVHGDENGLTRYGIVDSDLPAELRPPGQLEGVSAGVMASFALAALRALLDEVGELKSRLASA